MIELKFGDTIEQMKTIPDKSIDLICCDLPYGTTACALETIRQTFERQWKYCFDRFTTIYKHTTNKQFKVVFSRMDLGKRSRK